MTKIALFSFSSESTWMSCGKINQSLLSIYKELYQNDDIKEFSLSGEHFSNLTILDSIIDFNPDHFIFFDHRLNPSFILSPLSAKKYPLKDKLFTIHIYGHPFEKINWWLNCLKYLKDCKVNFKTSSLAMKKVFEKIFLKSPIIDVLPFTVSETFQFNQKKYLELRHKFKIKSGEKIFIYTGRISPQKNIHTLIHLIKEYRCSQSAHLFLIGPIDNFYPFVKNAIEMNPIHQHLICKMIKEVDPENEFIHYIPQLNEEELIPFYQMSDVFINLSTMTGEDYGMSITEAAACGLKIVLTKWAGHKDHANYIHDIFYIPVTKLKNDFELDFKNLDQYINDDSIELRTEKSRQNLNSYKQKSIVHHYRKSNGFSEFKLNKKYIFENLIRPIPSIRDSHFEEFYSELY